MGSSYLIESHLVQEENAKVVWSCSVTFVYNRYKDSIATKFWVLNCIIQCLTVYKFYYYFRDSQTSSPLPAWLYLVKNLSLWRNIKPTVSKPKQNQEELIVQKPSIDSKSHLRKRSLPSEVITSLRLAFRHCCFLHINEFMQTWGTMELHCGRAGSRVMGKLKALTAKPLPLQ